MFYLLIALYAINITLLFGALIYAFYWFLAEKYAYRKTTNPYRKGRRVKLQLLLILIWILFVYAHAQMDIFLVKYFGSFFLKVACYFEVLDVASTVIGIILISGYGFGDDKK